MQTLTIEAPAKVNLSLAVFERQPDGYHRLETVFERLDLADTLELTRSAGAGVTLTCTDLSVPTDGRNLIVQAAQAFARAAGISEGFRLHLIKRIPVAGGLGGGSSDAAATLLGLNTLWGTPLPAGTLMALGRQLGADVPFFVSQAVVALGRGRGDEITPWPAPPAPLWHLLVNPGVPLLTRAVYETYDRLTSTSRLTPPSLDVTLLLRSVQAGDPAAVAGQLVNALEPAIDASYPAIRLVKAALAGAGALGVLVSGSGPTTFGLAAGETQARAMEARIRRGHPDWLVVTARTALAPGAIPQLAPVRGE